MKLSNKSLCLILAGLVFLFWLMGCSPESIEDRAARIHELVLTVDIHADTPLVIGFYPDYDLGQCHDPETDKLQIDFPCMKEGALNAIFFVAFVAISFSLISFYESVFCL